MDNLNNRFLKFSKKQPLIPITIKDINVVKEMISDTTNQKISQNDVPKFDEEAIAGQKKLSSWLDETENAQNSPVDENETIVGHGSFTTQAIKDAGIDLNQYKKYFIGVYTNYYRFNPDTIKEDFPGRNIQTLADLKQAIDEFGTVVGYGSFTTQAIKDAGIDFKYFISVYINYYRFNPDAIRADFHGRVIKTLDDLKAAVEDRINPNSLFNETDEISADDLVKNLDSLLESDNSAIVKFAQKLKDLSNQYGINNYYDQEDLFKCVIMLMNKSAGIENTYPVTLSKNTVEELNKKGFFTQLDKIANGDELKEEYYFGVDGYIDAFGQGETGDCGLLAGIISLSSTEAGRNIIKQSISYDEKGNIIVTFKGIGISYPITPEEMIEARGIVEYSNGDNDIQAIELAVEKLLRQIDKKEISLNYGNYVPGLKDDDEKSGLIWGVQTYNLLYYLTGNLPKQFCYPKENVILNFLKNNYEDFQNDKICCYFYLSQGTYNVPTEDVNTNFEITLPATHAFAITNMTASTVTIANPWDSNQQYELSWEEFIKLCPSYLGSTSTELNEHN